MIPISIFLKCKFQFTLKINNLNLNVSARVIPFRMTFKTNADELSVATATVADGDEATGEEAVIPSGTVGFSLKYSQGAC